MAWELVEDNENGSEPIGITAKQAGQNILRHAGRSAANVGAGLVGGIGDLSNLASMGLEKLGIASPEGAEKFREKTLTTQKIKEGLQKEFPSLKPKNEIERFSDDIFETIGSLVGPSKSSLLKKFGLSVGANLGKEVIDQFKGESGSKEGNLSKAGILFLGSMINPKLAANEAAKKYSQAAKILPEGSRVPAQSLFKNLSELEKSITKGRPLSSISKAEKFVIDQANKTKDLIENGTISVEQALAQRKSMYEDLSNLYSEFGSKEIGTIKNLSKKIPQYLNKTISEYGKVNPEYHKLLKSADEIYGTLAKSKAVENWVSNTFRNHPITKMGLFGTASVTTQPGKLMYKIYKSPELRKLYSKALGEASKENARAFAKTSDELERKLNNKIEEERWEFID